MTKDLFFLPAEFVKIHPFQRAQGDPLAPMGGNGDGTKFFCHRNGVPMRADGHHIHLSQDGSLIISNVQEADEGSYTCSAYSSSNSVSASTEVKVLRSRPSSEYNLSSLLPQQCAGLLAAVVSLCIACAHPPPTLDSLVVLPEELHVPWVRKAGQGEHTRALGV